MRPYGPWIRMLRRTMASSASSASTAFWFFCFRRCLSSSSVSVFRFVAKKLSQTVLKSGPATAPPDRFPLGLPDPALPSGSGNPDFIGYRRQEPCGARSC